MKSLENGKKTWKEFVAIYFHLDSFIAANNATPLTWLENLLLFFQSFSWITLLLLTQRRMKAYFLSGGSDEVELNERSKKEENVINYEFNLISYNGERSFRGEEWVRGIFTGKQKWFSAKNSNNENLVLLFWHDIFWFPSWVGIFNGQT